MRNTSPYISLILLILLFQACKPTRLVKEGEHAIVGNEIILNNNEEFEYEGEESDLENVIKQRPYRKILGFIPFHISVYNWASRQNQERRIWSYLKNTVGEAPTIYEPVMLEKSRDQMLKALHNNGYFDARVDAFAALSDKTAEQRFYIYSGEPYLIRKVSYSFEDTALVKEFRSGVKTELRPGNRFDADVFEQERERLTKTMKNLGYFTFDKIHVIFDVDTNLEGHRFDVAVRLRNLRYTEQVDGEDTILERSHQKHFINQVIINESFSANSKTQSRLDTTEFRQYTFLHLNKPYIRPLRISRNIFIDEGDQYSLKKTNYTYGRLSALNNFRFIDMQYSTSGVDSNKALLDLKINLTKASKQAFSIETTGTNRSGNLGINVGLNYKNKNLFRGAEQLDWRVYGGLESQKTNSTVDANTNQVIEGIDFLNTYEFGSQITLTIPDFLMRGTQRELSWVREPKTNISAAVDRQDRPQYTRNLVNTSYQYAFRIREKDQMIIAPVDLSVIDLEKSKAFEEQLQATNNSLLINSYNNHIIPAGRISYSNTTQDINELKNFYYYRINFETAGNILRTLSRPLNLKYDEGRNSYLIDNIAFAQYVKLDLEFTRYLNLTEATKFVYRFYGGIGMPLSNLNALPFERSFFAGGSNGIRAWRARALGPGSLSDTATYGIDQVGESQMEFNFEYRFEIIKQLEAAVFTDVGNIWFNKFDPQRDGADFELDRFYRELAIAPGAGIRLNFNFFILRFDAGLQLKDPALPVGERWLFQPKTKTNLAREIANQKRVANDMDPVNEWEGSYFPEFTFNLAIGYPF